MGHAGACSSACARADRLLARDSDQARPRVDISNGPAAELDTFTQQWLPEHVQAHAAEELAALDGQGELNGAGSSCESYACSVLFEQTSTGSLQATRMNAAQSLSAASVCHCRTEVFKAGKHLQVQRPRPRQLRQPQQAAALRKRHSRRWQRQRRHRSPQCLHLRSQQSAQMAAEPTQPAAAAAHRSGTACMPRSRRPCLHQSAQSCHMWFRLLYVIHFLQLLQVHARVIQRNWWLGNTVVRLSQCQTACCAGWTSLMSHPSMLVMLQCVMGMLELEAKRTSASL